MTPEQIAVKLEDHEHEIGSLKHRMKAAEESTSALNKLVTSVAVMAEQMKTMNGNLATLTGKVERLEAEPGKRWKFVIEKAIYFVVAAVVGFVMAHVGL